MGSEKQEVSTVWDTGSDWFTVEVHDCSSGCDETNYDYSTSDDFLWAFPE